MFGDLSGVDVPRGLRQRLTWLVFGLLIPTTFNQCTNGFVSSIKGGGSFASSVPIESYQKPALEILTNNCLGCHGESGLGNVSHITNVGSLLATGLVVPGSPDVSGLLIVIEDSRMPTTGPLSAAETLALRNWILALGGINPSKSEVDLSFAMGLSTDPLPYRTRLAKLNSLPSLGGGPEFSAILENRFLLGDYDYSRSVVPRVSWEATDIKNWLESVQSICGSDKLRAQFPFPAKSRDLLQATLGRAVAAEDEVLISDVDSMALNSEEKSDIYCLALIGSLEFVAK